MHRGARCNTARFIGCMYICQAELLAYLCAYLTFTDLLEGHLIHHFGDNMAAISGVVKGGSSLPDSARAELRPCHSIPLPMTHIGPYLHTFDIICTHAPGLHNNVAVPERSVMVCATMQLVVATISY